VDPLSRLAMVPDNGANFNKSLETFDVLLSPIDKKRVGRRMPGPWKHLE
jgi:hypothetical protein